MTRAFSILALVLITLSLRLAFVNTAEQYPYIDDMAGDSRPYRERAADIRAGDLVGEEVFFDAPLYPYFLAIVNGQAGGSELAPKVAQAILDTGTACFVYAIARHLFGAGTGLIALALYAFYGMAVFYNGLLLKPALGNFLLASSVYALLAATRPGPERVFRPAPASFSGLLLGLAVLVRGNFLLALPVHAAALWRASGRRAALVAVVAAAIPVLAVTARNYVVGNDFVPLTYHAGPTFYHGNNPRADGTYKPILPGRQNPVYEKRDAIRIAEEDAGRELLPSEVSRYWFGRAFDHIASDIPSFAKLTLRRAALFWHPYEIPDTYDFSLYRSLFPVLALAFVSFALVAPLGVVGLFFPTRVAFRQSIPMQVVLALFLSLVLLFVFGRYRLPAVPFLIPTAARALHGIGAALRARRWRPATAGLGATCALAFLFSLTPVPRDETTGLYNLGIRMERLGRFAEAEALYRDAVEREPGFASGWNNLGGVLLQSGAPEEAAEAFRNAIEADPGHFLANRNLGHFHRDRREWTLAREHYERAWTTEPAPELALDRGVLEEMAQDRAAALTWYERAAYGEGRFLPEAALNLGRLRLESGLTGDAREPLGQAAQAFPRDAFATALHAVNQGLFDPGLIDETIDDLRARIGSPPEGAEPAPYRSLLHVAVARLFETAGEPDSALAAAARARPVRPGDLAKARYLAGPLAHDWGFPDAP